MSTRRLRRHGLGGTVFLCLLLMAASGGAQVQNRNEPLPDGSFLRYGCGDLDIRGGATMSLASKTFPPVMFVPDYGWTGDLFLARHNFEKGWASRTHVHDYNAFCFTSVGTGLAKELPRGVDDLILLSEKNLEAVQQLAISSHPRFIFAHGLGAAFALKARSLEVEVTNVLVLIDPVNPPDIGTKPDLSYAEVRERSENLEARLWVEWGIGPKPGVAYEDSDIGAEGFERLLERYERDQPRYWISATTGFDGKLVIGSGSLLKGLSVLIVGTPGRSREQRNSEKELLDWLEEREVQVERFELSDLGLPGLSRLPMVGDHADMVFDEILERATRMHLAAAK